MKKLSLVISLLYGTTLLNGCAWTPPAQSHNWTIEPFQTIRHATNRPDGYYRLGRFYQGQNRLDLAAEAYQKALAIDPTFSEAHNGLGTIYAAQGKFELALAEFNAVIATAPGAAHLYNNLGYLRFLQGDYTDAVAAFTRATVLDPTNQKARNNLGMALARGGEPMPSNQALALAAESTTSDQPHADKGPTHIALSNEVLKLVSTLTLPEDRGVIAPTSATKPESNVVVQQVADKTSADKAVLPAPVSENRPENKAVVRLNADPSSGAKAIHLADSTATKPESNVVVRQVADKTSADKAVLPAPVSENRPENKAVVSLNADPSSGAKAIHLADPTATKPESNVVVRQVAEKTSAEKAVLPATIAQPIFHPPFAVLAPPNLKAVTVVMTSGSAPTSIEKASGSQAKPRDEKPSPVSIRMLHSNKTANVIIAEQTASKAQWVMSPSKAVALTEAPIKAAPSRITRSTSRPGKRNFIFEVSNGNGINKLAARFSSMLSAKGLPKASLTNKRPFNQAHTVIQYRKGYLFEAARISRHLRGIQHLALMVESKNLPPHTDVRLILGKDASNKLRLDNPARPMTLASR